PRRASKFRTDFNLPPRQLGVGLVGEHGTQMLQRSLLGRPLPDLVQWKGPNTAGTRLSDYSPFRFSKKGINVFQRATERAGQIGTTMRCQGVIGDVSKH